MTVTEAVVFGMIGGALPETLALYKLRHSENEKKPYWIKSKFYWLVTILMILTGGFITFLYFRIGINLNEFIAVHIGAATPLIIGTLEKKQPAIS